MNRVDAAWAGFWVGFGVLDYVASRHGTSLCTSTRRMFHTDTPQGKALFATAYGAGAVVLFAHVVKQQRNDPAPL